MTDKKPNLHVIQGGGKPMLTEEEIRLEVFKLIWPSVSESFARKCRRGNTAKAYKALVPALTAVQFFTKYIKTGSAS